MSDTNRWDEIDSIVAQHKRALKKATSHEPLKEFAKEQGFDNKQDFGKYKVSLRKIGVDYNELREETFKKRDEEQKKKLEALPEDAPTIRLWAAAQEGDDGEGSFAIVDADRNAVWYGRFFEDDHFRQAGDVVSGEISAAEKAVWVASRAFAAAGVEVGRLILETTCPDVYEEEMRASGARYGIAVDVRLTDDDRAVEMALVPGYKRWQDSDLAELVSRGD